jgi:hypothetical protein
MKSRRTARNWALALSLAALPACNPYQNFSGEYYAGPIDGTAFPAAYQGELPGPADQGGGTIAASMAFSKGSQIFYFMFPFSDDQLGQVDPLALDSTVLSLPKAYLFDADPTAGNPFPKAKCTGPQNYIFDQRAEAFRADEQGVVFSTTPNSAGYIPVVAEVPETAMGRSCQDIKSKQTLLNVMKDPGTDANFLAFAIIDPTSDVTPHTALGLGPIREGWYNHYLITYLEGGYIPTESVPGMMGGDPYTRMTPQTLYSPTAIPGMDDNMVAVPVAGGPGTGWDILDAARGEAGYSPVCHVLSYVPDDALHPKKSVADLSATELASAGSATADLGFFFCLQP